MAVTLPLILPDEAQQINALFAAGLQRLHLRKPDEPETAITALVEAVDPQYYTRIAWHQHHHLALRFGSRRLHFPEWMRQRYAPEVWRLLQAEHCLLSTSVHQETVLPACFSYAFAGPVFDSISKPGYKAGTWPDAMFADGSRVAIGGIDAGNCAALRMRGIQSIAVSGALWQSTCPVKAFHQINHAWHTTGPSSSA